MKLQMFVILASLTAFGTIGHAANLNQKPHALHDQNFTDNRKSDKCDATGDATSNSAKCGLMVPAPNGSFMSPSERSEGPNGGTIPGQ